MDKIYILHQIECGKNVRAYGTIENLEQNPKGEEFGLNRW